MLSENILAGKWKMVRGQIQKAWGKLTDEELDQTRGNLSQLAGLVQERYGENQESIRSRIKEFISEIADTDTGKEFKPLKK